MSLEKALQLVENNERWSVIIPADLSIEDGIGLVSEGVAAIRTLHRKSNDFRMMLGAVLDALGKKKSSEWKRVGYSSYTNFCQEVLTPIASNGSQGDYLNLYRTFKDQPMEMVRQCPVSNLKAVIALVNGGASSAQKADLLDMASNPPAEFNKLVESAGYLAPGEAGLDALKIVGSRGKIAELKAWLDRQSVSYVDALLAATAEHDSEHAGDIVEAAYERTPSQ